MLFSFQLTHGRIWKQLCSEFVEGQWFLTRNNTIGRHTYRLWKPILSNPVYERVKSYLLNFGGVEMMKVGAHYSILHNHELKLHRFFIVHCFCLCNLNYICYEDDFFDVLENRRRRLSFLFFAYHSKKNSSDSILLKN